jgi:hypothetical protein
MYGSVRGALSDERPYRDRNPSRPPRTKIPILQTKGAACTGELVRGRLRPQGCRGRSVRAGTTGSIPPRRERSKNLRGSYYSGVESR